MKENGYVESKYGVGKKGFRVYPDWDRPNSKQAIKIQALQEQFFKRSSYVSSDEII